MSRVQKVGDPVIHHGHLHHITRFKNKAVVQQGPDGSDVATLIPKTIFENDGFSVEADKADLVWSESDGAWHLPGRILARNERAVFQAITGAWPPAENHFAVRQMLDSVDLNTVNRDRLAQVLKTRKLDVKQAIAKARDDAKLAGEDEEAAERKLLYDYVDAALAQVGTLRDARKGGVTNG